MKIVSGGQTGADRAALDVALTHGLEIGGWVPRGRLAEDGRIPDRYDGLSETGSVDPSERTRFNVRDSDATVIVSHGQLRGGSLLTLDEARRIGKPVLHVDMALLDLPSAVEQLRAWLERVQPAALNVAGPRASEDGEIYDTVVSLLRKAVLNA